MATKKSTKKKKQEIVKPDISDSVIPCAFIPKKDITAFELSTLLHFILKGQVTHGDWDSLNAKCENITRHFTTLKELEEKQNAK